MGGCGSHTALTYNLYFRAFAGRAYGGHSFREKISIIDVDDCFFDLRVFVVQIDLTTEVTNVAEGIRLASLRRIAASTGGQSLPEGQVDAVVVEAD